ncbi:MAG: polysaccharide deacetylase family protein [Calditrichaeota bacterium]|nr:polysaccharide deacetylase family protein [Calditrichota bacterium]RQV92594.1 MAG: polysaccharide deacetylase family protein [bacterium]RQW07592.1 MAG: polysaccharide deacetylase family protein [Calditrichota bacterium]
MDPDLFRIPILTYHKITIRRELGLNTIPPDLFESHMEILKVSGFSAVTFRDLREGNLPHRPVIITFDDGYSSVCEHALPILKKFNFSAVIFIVTGYIGIKNTWDANLGGITFTHLHSAQIKLLSESGMEIGSHGVTHRAFTLMKDWEVSAELEESRQKIFKITGRYPQTIAYPFGMQNKKIRQTAIQKGYYYGCINMWGRSAPLEKMVLRRIPVYRTDHPAIFRMKFCSGWKNSMERTRLRIISFPALLTPVYQKYIKKMY